MNIYVFLSTGFRGETEETMKRHREFVKDIIKMEYESLRNDEDKIVVVDNFDFVADKDDFRNQKLLTYSSALAKMAACDAFVLLKESDGSIKSGCMLEMNAWVAAGGVQPIVRQKIKES